MSGLRRLRASTRRGAPTISRPWTVLTIVCVVALFSGVSTPAASQTTPAWPAGRWISEGEFGRDDASTTAALHTEGFFDFRVIVTDDGSVLDGGVLSLQGARIEEEPVEHTQALLSFRGDSLIPEGSAQAIRATGEIRITGEVLTEVTGTGFVPVPVDYQGPVTVGLVTADATCASVEGILVADFAAQIKVPVGLITPFYAVPETVGQQLYNQIVELDVDIYEAIAHGEPVDIADLQRLVLLVEQLNAAIARGANCGVDLERAAPGGPTHIWLEKILLDALRNILARSDELTTAELLAAFQAGIRGGALTMTARDSQAAANLFQLFDQLFSIRAETAYAEDDVVTIDKLHAAACQYHLSQTKAATE
jgi:hypothetical protein